MIAVAVVMAVAVATTTITATATMTATYSSNDLFISSTLERRLSHGFVRSSLLCSVAESRESLFSTAESANSWATDLTYVEVFPSLLCGEPFHFPPLLRPSSFGSGHKQTHAQHKRNANSQNERDGWT